VQAIARQLQYLNPDIITLNEIPNGLRYQMTNWMTAFFQGYNLAISPGNRRRDSQRRDKPLLNHPLKQLARRRKPHEFRL